MKPLNTTVYPDLAVALDQSAVITGSTNRVINMEFLKRESVFGTWENLAKQFDVDSIQLQLQFEQLNRELGYNTSCETPYNVRG